VGKKKRRRKRVNKKGKGVPALFTAALKLFAPFASEALQFTTAGSRA